MKNKEEIEDEIKSLARKRDEHLVEANKIQEQMMIKVETMYSMDPSMVKITCINCGGLGYSKEGEKKQVCKLCNMKRYNWMPRFKEEDNGERISTKKRSNDIDDSA
jgi:hypothetical protein